MKGWGILVVAVCAATWLLVTPSSEADLGEFDSNPVWPLCGRITENPPAGWDEDDGCPAERWGNPAFTDTPISSTFGCRQLVSGGYRYDFHRGIDIGTPIGTAVFAFADGEVKKAGPDPAYSDPLVQLRHKRPGEGSCSSGGGCYHTNYLHMSGWTVNIGDDVSKGDLIGYSGESASGFDHVHFEIRDAPPQDPFSNWSRDAVHPLGVLPYPDTGTSNFQLVLDSVDATDPMNPEVYVTLTIPMSVELDLDGFEALVFEHQPDGTLSLVSQPGDTPVGNTIEGTGYLVEPSWYSMNVWNRMYSYKNSGGVSWSSFEEEGVFESPYWMDLPESYNANVHMDAAPNDFQVGEFNGWSWEPSHTNANSSEYTLTVGLLSLTGTAAAEDLCVQVRALDVHGNATDWVRHNCLPPCQENFSLTAGNWKQISLACDPGAAASLEAVFGDDLSGTYKTDWFVFRREHHATDPGLDHHVAVELGEDLEVGEGYWIKTGLAQVAGSEGVYNVPVEVELAQAAAGRYSLVGHPFEYEVCWSDVEVLKGAATLTLDQAHAQGVISRIAYKWTGASYAAFDGQTPGLEGTLVPFDGFWVKAYEAPPLEIVSLRIPATGGNCGAPAETLSESVALRKKKKNKRKTDWFVRLIAESGGLRDEHNVLGQLGDSVKGLDSHDLPELSAFSAPYLSIVFPQDDWGSESGDYTSDFHGLKKRAKDSWYFEVASSEIGETVTLRWEADEVHLKRSFLLDAATGKRFKVKPGGSYSFTVQSEREGFYWLVK